MVKTKGKATKTIIAVSIPVAIFLILQSLGIGVFSIISILEPEDTRNPTGLLRTGLRMTQSGSNVYVAWTDASSDQDIFFRASTDAGGTFEPVINLSSNEAKSYTRSIASEGSAVYVAWIDEEQENLDLFFRSSTDGGRTFAHAENLNKNAGDSDFPIIDADGPAVYVAWLDSTPGNDEIFFRASHDAGMTFGETINISNTTGNSEAPAIAALGSNVYVVWHDDTEGNFDVMFRASHDSGRTFGPAVNLSKDFDGNSGFAVPDAKGSTVYLAWIGESVGNHEIFFRASRDAGITFEPVLNLSRSETKSGFPLIDADGPLVAVGWIEESQEGQEILFTRSVDGSRFDEPISIASSSGQLRSYTIEVEGIDLYTSWIEEDDGGGFDQIFLRTSNDAGLSFEPAVGIALGSIDDAGIVAKGTSVYAVWSDKKCYDENDVECASIAVNAYFKRSEDRGFTFGNPIKLNS